MYYHSKSDGFFTSIVSYLQSLRKQYRCSRKSQTDSENFCFRWYRPISFYPTAIFLRLGVTANAVTAWGFLSLLSAFVLLAQGHLLLGALLYLMAYILDFVDGNIARYVGKSSNFGKTIDGLVDVLTFLLFIAIGLGNFRAGEAMLDSSTEMMLGITSSFVFLLRNYFYLRLSNILETTKREAGGAVFPVIKSGTIFKILLLGKVGHSGLISAMPLLLLLSVLFNAVSLYLAGYFLIFIVALPFEVAYGLRLVWLRDNHIIELLQANTVSN